MKDPHPQKVFAWSASPLKKIPVSKRLSECPGFLIIVVTDAKKSMDPLRIWIFGSRASGDQNKFSDYDLAFELSGDKTEQWTQFLVDQEEKIQTLLGVDLLLWNSVSEKLKDQIRETGVLIYEKN